MSYQAEEKELPLIDSRIPEILEPTNYSWVNSFEDSCVMLRFAVFTAPAVRKRVFRVLRREIKGLFDREHSVLTGRKEASSNNFILESGSKQVMDLPIFC